MLSDEECIKIINKIIEESRPLKDILAKCKTREEKLRATMMWGLKRQRISLPVKEVKVPVEVIKKVEVIKEVPVEVVKYVDREVVKEVEVIKEVDKTDQVQVEQLQTLKDIMA